MYTRSGTSVALRANFDPDQDRRTIAKIQERLYEAPREEIEPREHDDYDEWCDK